MKKLLVLLLVNAVLILCVACFDGKENPSIKATEDGGTPTQSQSPSMTTPTTDPVGEATEPVELDEVHFVKSATISETALYDKNDVRITATEIEYTNYYVKVKLLFENNTETSLSFVSGSMAYCCNSINNYMMYGGFVNCNVEAGKKAYDTVNFEYQELMMCGILAIEEMELAFNIFDEDRNVNIQTGPMRLTTSIDGTADNLNMSFREAVSNVAIQKIYEDTIDFVKCETFYEKNEVSIVSAGVLITEEDTLLLLEVSNKGSQQINFAVGDIAINGIVVSWGIYETETINVGKTGIITVKLTSVLDSELWEVLDISGIDSVSANISLKDMDHEIVVDKTLVSFSRDEQSEIVNTDGVELYNSDEIRVIYKGMVEDASEYSEDLYVVLLIENMGERAIQVDGKSNSLSVNGVMFGYFGFKSVKLHERQYGVVIVTLSDANFENVGISNTSDIRNIELVLRLHENYDTLDEPTISIVFQ